MEPIFLSARISSASLQWRKKRYWEKTREESACRRSGTAKQLRGLHRRFRALLGDSKVLNRALPRTDITTMDTRRNPTFFCIIFGLGAFAVSAAYLFMQGLIFS